MREFTIQVPEGWLTKLLVYLLLIFSGLLAWPFYQVYLQRIEARSVVEHARAEVEARTILGECSNESTKGN